MQDKIMIGETIYRLRKRAGMTQSELAERLNVSNKAVSKWETEEANPEITLLPAIAKVLNCSVDDLISGNIEPKNSDDDKLKNQDTSYSSSTAGTSDMFLNFFPVRGKINRGAGFFEFVSERKTKDGLPYVHINFGAGRKANGIVAVGFRATGILSVGLVSCGIFSVGLLSLGLISIGLLCFGLLATGMMAAGILAVGGVAAGVLAVGGIVAGYMVVGGIAAGYIVHTGTSGIAIGVEIIRHASHWLQPQTGATFSAKVCDSFSRFVRALAFA